MPSELGAARDLLIVGLLTIVRPDEPPATPGYRLTMAVANALQSQYLLNVEALNVFRLDELMWLGQRNATTGTGFGFGPIVADSLQSLRPLCFHATIPDTSLKWPGHWVVFRHDGGLAVMHNRYPVRNPADPSGPGLIAELIGEVRRF